MYQWLKRSLFIAIAVAIIYLAMVYFLDRALLQWQITENPGAFWTSLAQLIAHIFKTKFWLVGAFVIVVGCHCWSIWLDTQWRILRAKFAYVFAAVFCSALITGVLKVLLGRSRPIEWIQHQAYGFHFIGLHHAQQSSPSGHTTVAFALAIAIACLIQNSWGKLVLFLLAVLVGVSRLIILQHYLSDVFLAASIGTWVALFLRANYYPWLLSKCQQSDNQSA